MEKNQKTVKVSAILISVLFIISVFGWKAWQAYRPQDIRQSEPPVLPFTSPTGWKTYRNEDMNFTIQYPGNMKIEEGYLSSPIDAPPNKNLPYVYFSTSPSPSGYYWNLSINVMKLANEVAAKTWYENQHQPRGEECEETLLSGDIKTIKCQSVSDNSRVYPIHYLFFLKNFGYDIYSGYEVMEKDAYVLEKIAAHDLMLKSFKILRY